MKIANNSGSVITKLGIGCAVCLFLGVGILLYAQEKTKSEFIGTKSEMGADKINKIDTAKMQAMAKAKEQTAPQGNRTWGRQNRGGGVDFREHTAFYKTIIDNNLFRPLGWTPPNNEPSYSLIGTKAVDSNNAISQATLLERRSNRYHFVTIGTKIGDMTVKDIQAKKVIFDKAGETVTLRTGGLQLLTAKRERGGDNRSEERDGGESEKASNNERENRAREMEAEKRRQMEQKRRHMEGVRRDAMEKMRHASSPEERREIMEWLKKEAAGK